MKKLLLGISLIFFTTVVSFAQSLDYDLIDNNVLEVVIPKKENPGIVFEKELPTDLLPFSYRTDKYLSIGSAFRIGDNLFLSAAHVFEAGKESFLDDYMLRDRAQNVFKVGTVYKYSNDKDFILFSINEADFSGFKGGKKFLETTEKFKPATKVYTAGNALGEGIVIRDGMLTSTTPEDMDGRWNWIRFSAAASPGNSGGPLLNDKNQVLGIVTMKSRNENLNYALPLSEVFAFAENTAELKLKLSYSIPNLGENSIQDDFESIVELPLSFEDLNKAFTADFVKWTTKAINQLKTDLKAMIFPFGKESAGAIYNVFNAAFPSLLAISMSGDWGPYRPGAKPVETEEDLIVETGTIAGLSMAKVTSKDTEKLKRIWKNPNFMMDNIFQADKFFRNMAGERIRIITPGKSSKTRSYVDSYGRKWSEVYWDFDYSDQQLLAIIHKTPDGVFVMYQLGETGSINNGIAQDYRFMSDFFYIAYKGNLEQWQLYMQKKLMPPVLKDHKIFFDEKSISITSTFYSLSENTGDWKWDKDSILEITPGYRIRDGKASWEVRNINIEDSSEKPLYISVTEYLAPGEDAPEKYVESYEEISNGEKPFNRELQKTKRRQYRYTTVKKNENLFTIYTSYPVDIEPENAIDISERVTDSVRGYALSKEEKAKLAQQSKPEQDTEKHNNENNKNQDNKQPDKDSDEQTEDQQEDPEDNNDENSVTIEGADSIRPWGKMNIQPKK